MATLWVLQETNVNSDVHIMLKTLMMMVNVTVSGFLLSVIIT
jgi:hypothetical protein